MMESLKLFVELDIKSVASFHYLCICLFTVSGLAWPQIRFSFAAVYLFLYFIFGPCLGTQASIAAPVCFSLVDL